MATVALIDLDYNAFGGQIQATATGWHWNLTAAVSDRATGQKDFLQGFGADTLDADSLATVQTKIIAAVKAEAATRGYTVTTAIVPAMNLVTGV